MSRRMAGELLKYFLLLDLVRLSQANIAAVCATSDSYWEVDGNKQDNTFTCTGLSAQHTVQWDHWAPATGASSSLGECKPRLSAGSQYVCDQPVSPLFLPTRTSDDTSVMVVNALAVTSTRLFDNGRLRCTAAYGTTLNGSANCRLDYIIAGTNISCTVQFRKDTWSVFGQCSTEKIYSAQNRYRCAWIQIKESREEILIANTSMTVMPKVSGWCNMTSYLPPVGQYTYRVTLVPGEVTVNASFVGNNTIRLPGSKPSHNCPQYIPEGGNLSCTCFANDLGSPPGELQWNSTRSSQLRFSAVQPGDTGTHTCQLLWNNTVVQSLEYILTVAC
ncbi:uncharacterized protein LOC112567585 [Pomacea canaliculata]|uniref:uncharacterized protein LOC112567585 n=1 Tax=Pomacea canaliculata TaxID=400727 RepID=UPI000D735B1A|nr:uncharacterized protein LOC112567585 [Pomacea canaliculata]